MILALGLLQARKVNISKAFTANTNSYSYELMTFIELALPLALKIRDQDENFSSAYRYSRTSKSCNL